MDIVIIGDSGKPVQISGRLEGQGVVDGIWRLLDVDDSNNPVPIQTDKQRGATASWPVQNDDALDHEVRNVSQGGIDEDLYIKATQDGVVLSIQDGDGNELPRNTAGEVLVGTVKKNESITTGISLSLS